MAGVTPSPEISMTLRKSCFNSACGVTVDEGKIVNEDRQVSIAPLKVPAFHRCEGCGLAEYCSLDCMKIDAPEHSKVCKAIDGSADADTRLEIFRRELYGNPETCEAFLKVVREKLEGVSIPTKPRDEEIPKGMDVEKKDTEDPEEGEGMNEPEMLLVNIGGFFSRTAHFFTLESEILAVSHYPQYWTPWIKNIEETQRTKYIVILRSYLKGNSGPFRFVPLLFDKEVS